MLQKTHRFVRVVIKAGRYQGRNLACEITEAPNLEDPSEISFSHFYKARSLDLNLLMSTGDVFS